MLREAEMEGQWIADIADFEYADVPPTPDEILELTREFQEFLGDGGSDRRKAFAEPGGAGRVLPEMNQQIRERRKRGEQ